MNAIIDKDMHLYRHCLQRGNGRGPLENASWDGMPKRYALEAKGIQKAGSHDRRGQLSIQFPGHRHTHLL